MEFYHAPGTCSQATHRLLHQARVDFLSRKVDIFDHVLEDGSDYRLVNPNGYVPALVLENDMLLTENVAIIDWIANRSPELLPEGAQGRTRHLQMLAFISTELHKPFIPLFFIEDPDEQARLREALKQRFCWIGSRIEGAFLFGDRVSGADALLYVMLRWAAKIELESLPVFTTFIKSIERLDSVKMVLAAEELKPLHRVAETLSSPAG